MALQALGILAEQNHALLLQAGVPWESGYPMPPGSKLTGGGKSTCKASPAFASRSDSAFHGGGYCIQFAPSQGPANEGSLTVPLGCEAGVRVRRLSVVSDMSQ